MESPTTESEIVTAPAAPSRGARALATVGGIGNLKPGSGTWASAATTLAWLGVASVLPQSWRWPAAAAAAALVTLVGIPAATRVAREDRDPDPGHVVIDEVAGQLIALIGAPLGWKSLLAGFILFRAFDILKPPPVRQLEQLPEGTGIMLDDVGAGIFALVVMQLLLHYGWIS